MFRGYKIWLHLEAIDESKNIYVDCVEPIKLAQFEGVKNCGAARLQFDVIANKIGLMMEDKDND